MSEDTNIYHVGCSTDDNYIHHASVMLCSLLENNRGNEIVIHVLYGSLSDANMDFLKGLAGRYGSKICFHQVDHSSLEGVKFRTVRPLSMAAYYRLLLSSVLEDVDKALYLDVDTAVLGDISPLFDLEMEDYALAAVKDVVPCFDDHRAALSIPYDADYFCSAVMLVNLKYWREHGCEPLLLEFAKRDRVVFCHDQDALNYVFKGRWYQLPPKWNRFNMNYIPASGFRDYRDRYEYYHAPVIIHFSDYKPARKCFCVKFAGLYRSYLELSGCPVPSVEKVSFWDRLAPVRMYVFRTVLKCLGLYDRYLYRRLWLRKKCGRA